MAGIYDMARELGGALARTDEYQALKRAMDAVGDDRELTEIRNRLERLEGRIEASLRQGKEPDDEVKQSSTRKRPKSCRRCPGIRGS